MAKKKVDATVSVDKKADLTAKINTKVAKWNESAEFSEYKVMKKLEGEISELLEEYTAICEGDCFAELKKADNVMKAAAEKLTFQTLSVKDKKEVGADGKETGKTIKVVGSVDRRIDPQRLHKSTKDGIGANTGWLANVEELDAWFTAAAAIKLNAEDNEGNKLNLQKIRDTKSMSDAARKLMTDSGKLNPNTDKVMLEKTQAAVDAMLGEGYKVLPEHIEYLRRIHSKAGKNPKVVSVINAKTMRTCMLDVCNMAITGSAVVLDYKKAKKN